MGMRISDCGFDTMKPETTLWMDDAEYDLESAKAMLDSGRFFFVVFMATSWLKSCSRRP